MPVECLALRKIDIRFIYAHVRAGRRASCEHQHAHGSDAHRHGRTTHFPLTPLPSISNSRRSSERRTVARLELSSLGRTRSAMVHGALARAPQTWCSTLLASTCPTSPL